MRASKLLHRILKFINYANLFKINEKCYFVISWPILILFVLSDRAWCGLQNFYTEFWNSLIMQIYAYLFKINEKCYFSVISWPILIMFVLSDRAWCGLQNIYTEFWNSLIMQMYANLFKINEKCYFSISWAILILFGLSDRAWWGLQNFFTEYWNSLIMQIYSKSMKNATSPLLRNHNKSALPAGTYITHRVIYYPLVPKSICTLLIGQCSLNFCLLFRQCQPWKTTGCFEKRSACDLWPWLEDAELSRRWKLTQDWMERWRNLRWINFGEKQHSGSQTFWWHAEIA